MPYSSGGGRASLACVDRGVGLSGTTTFTASFPWKGYVNPDGSTNFEGRHAMAEKITQSAFLQLGPILVAAGGYLGLTIEQISTSYAPGEQKLGRYERAYRAKLVPQETAAAGLSGMGAADNRPDLQKIFIESMKKALLDEIIKQAIQAALKAMGTAIPIAGALYAAYEAYQSGGFEKGDTESKVVLAVSLAAAIVACFVPIVGWVVAIVIVCYAAFKYYRAKQDMEEAERQQAAAEHWQKYVKSVTDIAVEEAKLLIDEMAVRGIDPRKITDPAAAASKLRGHYTSLLVNFRAKRSKGPEWMEDNKATLKPQYDKRREIWHAERDKRANEMLKLAMAKWDLEQSKLPFSKRRPSMVGGKVIPEVLDPVKRAVNEISGAPASYEGVLAQKWDFARDVSHKTKIGSLLQAARDMRILRVMLSMTPSSLPVDEVSKLASQTAARTAAAVAAASQQAAATIREIEPAAAAEVEKMTPAQVAKLVAGVDVGVGEKKPSGLESPAAKVVATVAVVGAATGLGLLVWKLVAATKAVK